MIPQTSPEEVCQFIDLVNHSCDIWASFSHVLVYLTKITHSEVKFKWTKIEQELFDENKQILDHGVLLAYPYFNEGFKSHTNTRDF